MTAGANRPRFLPGLLLLSTRGTYDSPCPRVLPNSQVNLAVTLATMSRVGFESVVCQATCLTEYFFFE